MTKNQSTNNVFFKSLVSDRVPETSRASLFRSLAAEKVIYGSGNRAVPGSTEPNLLW